MNDTYSQAIAIVGAAGRFPHARNLDEFWQRLAAGEELVTFFSDEELLAAGVDPALLANPNYVKARAVLEDAELFDALFFGINPREAEVLDPQQRIFLETAWQALEDAGCDADRYPGAIGVYAGLSMNSYLFTNLLPRPDLLEQIGGYQLMLASDKDFVATRASYKLNLRGPSINVQTACSTSLVAVQMACQSLLNYQCDVALAGGVSIASPRVGGYLYQQGMIMSPDGHCRPFDARGQGIVAGEGAGIVVLKRLSEALDDGDTIRAVILAAAVNNDGADKVGYTAPSVQGQAEVIAMAQAVAGVHPETIQYVEAHGTGTILGDPIEIAALTQAFRLQTSARNFCAIGSVKSNLGHLDAAAGVAGLIKTMLSLQHRQIPPTLHFETPNPNIDFAGSPFYVAAKLAEWPAQATPRRAGVSSFGIGGTNAHVVLEEAPPAPESARFSEMQPLSRAARRYHMLPLSALTPSALNAATAALAAHLEAHPELALADVAYTLQTGRKTFAQRRFVVCADGAEAVQRLAACSAQPPAAAQDARRRPVAFLFPGQGAQYAGMGRDLYTGEAIFRSEVDRCAAVLQPLLGLDLRDLLFAPADHAEEANVQLRRTAITQPALFVIEYALARLWMTWGLQPAAMLGHSIGEYVAACLAGVFSLEDGLALVAARGRLMQSLPAGDMLAVPLAESMLLPYLGSDLALAAVNAPQMCVVSGPSGVVEALRLRLAADGIQCQPLHTSHAFHSPMMDPILAEFTARVAQVQLHEPALPYLSNLTGTWITPEQATDPRYWAQHLRSTVRFAQGAALLFADTGMILLEAGPGHSLTSLVRQHSDHTAAQPVLPSLRHPHDKTPDDLLLMQTLGGLWLAGAEIDWTALHADAKPRRVPLPTYPFERSRYWVNAPGAQASSTSGVAPAAAAPAPMQAPAKRADLASWFYTPSWQRQDLPPALSTAPEQPQNWLLFADGQGLAAQLAARLQSAGHTVTTVRSSPVYGPIDDSTYQLAPGDEGGYLSLFDDLRRKERFPNRIVHLWNVSAAPDAVAAAQDVAFYSLLHLAQALAQAGSGAPVRLDVVASGLHDVIGSEALSPIKALLLGPCLVIPQEYPHITCRSIDLDAPHLDLSLDPSGATSPGKQAAALWAELHAAPAAVVVALRGRHRWVQRYMELPLPPADQTPALLRPRGVYLITGGLGGIGLALAELLARTVQARLVLTARTALPQRAAWEDWRAEHEEDDPTSRKIAAVQALEALGSEVLVVQADVADEPQMRAAVAAAHSAFGEINGVVHAAGVAGGGIIPFKTRAMADRVLAPKVLGTAILDQVLAHEPLEFVVLCSSFNAMLGGVGQIDYSAGNAYLDAFAHAKARQSGPTTISINWGTWQEVGMAFATEVPEQLRQVKEMNLRNGLRTAEGQAAFERVLANPLPQLIVSPQDLFALLNLIKPTDKGGETEASGASLASSGTAAMPEQPSSPAPAPELHARPPLPTAYVAPRTSLEAEIASVWQQLFAIDAIGVDDNFFALGGHSLLVTQLVVRLQERFGVELPMRTVFEAHTIAELAGQLETLLWMAQNQQMQGEASDEEREEVEF